MSDSRKEEAPHLQGALDMIEESKRKALSKTVLPHWFSVSVSVIIGILAITVGYLGRPGAFVALFLLIPFALHIKTSKARLRFLTPANEVLGRGLDEFKANPIAHLFIWAFVVATPFIFMWVLELKAAGHQLAPVFFGCLMALFAYTAAEVSRRYNVKKYG